MSAANPQQAAREARALLARALPGSRRGAVREHLQRAERIGEAIWRRFQVSPRQWQVKHLRWYLEQARRDLAPTTRYDHWRTVRALIHALGKAEAWTAHLRGPWLRPQGEQGRPLGIGRPAKLPPGEESVKVYGIVLAALDQSERQQRADTAWRQAAEKAALQREIDLVLARREAPEQRQQPERKQQAQDQQKRQSARAEPRAEQSARAEFARQAESRTGQQAQQAGGREAANQNDQQAKPQAPAQEPANQNQPQPEQRQDYGQKLER